MIVLIWIVTILILGLVFGEIRHRLNLKKKMVKNEKVNKLIDNSLTDNDIHNLSSEENYSGYIPLTVLSTRGSWRLGQDNTLNYIDFSTLRDEEYSKTL